MQPETSDSYELRITPAGTGYRVTVSLLPDRRGVATSIENSPYEAAVIGVGLYHRWKAEQ